MAAEALNVTLAGIDNLRGDLIVVTEYHAKYNSEEDLYEVFVPAGTMLTEKFKPESYYDIFLHTYVVPFEEEQNDENRFKFVVSKVGRYDGRSMHLFGDIAKDGMIPNNLEMVLSRVRKTLGI